MMAALDVASLDMIIDICNPPHCDAAGLAALRLWRFTFLGNLALGLDSFPGNGAFIDTCLVHEQNVDYCAGQGQQNCHGWLTYNVTAPGFAPQLTPQAGFSVWADATFSRYDDVMAEREAWHARVQGSLAGGPAAYPTRSAAEIERLRAGQVAIIDPLEWPGNPSCPFGTS
jgi:hypothetical protein